MLTKNVVVHIVRALSYLVSGFCVVSKAVVVQAHFPENNMLKCVR